MGSLGRSIAYLWIDDKWPEGRSPGQLTRGASQDMWRKQGWGGILAVIMSLIPRVAHAQIFTPPVNPFELSAQRMKRLTIGTFWAQWGLAGGRSGRATLEWDADPGPLIAGD